MPDQIWRKGAFIGRGKFRKRPLFVDCEMCKPRKFIGNCFLFGLLNSPWAHTYMGKISNWWQPSGVPTYQILFSHHVLNGIFLDWTLITWYLDHFIFLVANKHVDNILRFCHPWCASHHMVRISSKTNGWSWIGSSKYFKRTGLELLSCFPGASQQWICSMWSIYDSALTLM